MKGAIIKFKIEKEKKKKFLDLAGKMKTTSSKILRAKIDQVIKENAN